MQEIQVFGLSLPVMAWLMPALFSGLWWGYRLTHTLLYSPSLSRVHLWFSGVTALCVVLLVLLGIQASPLVINQHQWMGMLIRWLSIAFILSQCFFLLNLGMGICRRRGIILRR